MLPARNLVWSREVPTVSGVYLSAGVSDPLCFTKFPGMFNFPTAPGKDWLGLWQVRGLYSLNMAGIPLTLSALSLNQTSPFHLNSGNFRSF